MSATLAHRPGFADPRVGLRVGLARFINARQRAVMLRYAVRGVAAGALLAAFVGSLTQIFDLTYGLPVVLGVWIGVTIAAAGFGWLRRVPEGKIALEIDRGLGLDERVTTALELASSSIPPRSQRHRGGTRASSFAEGEGTEARSSLATEQMADAVAHFVTARPSSVYPIRVTWRSLGLALAMSLLALAPWFVTWPAFLSASVSPSLIAAVTQAEATRLDTVAARIENQDAPSDSTVRAQIAAQLRQAADAIRQSRANGGQATSDLLRAQQAAGALAPQTGEDASLTLARIADALNGQPATQPTTSALDQQDVNQAAADLQQLATNVGSMSTQQRQDLASALQAAGAAAQGSDTSAAEQLQQAANAAKSGDSQGMQQAAQALQQLGAASQAQRDVAQAQSELQSSSEAIAQAGQNSPSSTDQPSGSAVPSSQDGSAPSSGQPNDSGSSDQVAAANPIGSAQSTDGSQTGQSSSGSESPSGSAQGASGQQPGGQSGSGAGQGSTDHLGAPNDLQGLAERQVMVPSNQQGDPTTIQSSNQLQTGTAGTAQVDYVNVLPQYQQQAQQVVEGNVVPTGLKQVVKGYFDSLTPK